MTPVFHGSPDHHIKQVVPKRNIRSKEVEGTSLIVFDQLSFHASAYRWVALAYLCHEVSSHSMAIDLYGNKKEVCIIGPYSLEDGLTCLYGKGGYLHTFNTDDFWWCEGLGSLEVITNKAVSPLEVTFIQNPILEMLKEGVEFIFKNKSQT